jgi:hypothetical protein
LTFCANATNGDNHMLLLERILEVHRGGNLTVLKCIPEGTTKVSAKGVSHTGTSHRLALQPPVSVKQKRMEWTIYSLTVPITRQVELDIHK